jgi:hypothetical protein
VDRGAGGLASGIASVHGKQGFGELAVQQRQVHLRAQLVEVSRKARSLEPLGPRGQVRVGGQHACGWQVPPGQRGRACILGPALDPRHHLRLLLAAARSGRVGSYRLAARCPPKFSRGPPGRSADYRRFHP